MADGLYYYEWRFNDWLGSGTRAMMGFEDRAIYRDLLDHQAAAESLPDDCQALANMGMCSVGQIKSFLDRWGDALFPVCQDGLRRNKKLQANRNAIIERLEKRSSAGKQGANARWNGKRNATAYPDAMAILESESELESDKESEIKRKKKTQLASVLSDFDAWWEIYPHKVGKKPASKSYCHARKAVGSGVLITGLQKYIRNKPHDRPWLNPATWLNQERWNDQPAAKGSARPKTGLAVLNDSELDSLYAYIGSKIPELSGLPKGQNEVRSAMCKYLPEWKARINHV